MDCPRDGTTLEVDATKAIPVETCSACGGMFLDHGELNKLAEPTSGDLEYSTVHDDSFEHRDVFPVAKCPRCAGSGMKKVEFNIYTDIILDYCDRCSGFWLDGTELDRINAEVRQLNRESQDEHDPPMLWFARFVWSLPR